MKRSLKIGLVLSVVFAFTLFFLISYLSPLAGDDWGYAVNGQLYNPFKLAFEFYFTWSGRFFSELYGFLVTPNKWIWNLLNPFLFTSIFLLLYLLTSSNRKFISVPVILFLMLSVKDELRMETYTWLMGTTYVIPLFLSLFYLYNLKKLVFEEKQMQLKDYVLNSICLFVIGMSMENISAAILAMNIVVLIYLYLKDRNWNRSLIMMSLISLASFVLLRLSPGASLRLMRDHPNWLKLGLFDQIVVNYPNLIRFTFIEHRYLVLFFSLGLSFVLLNKLFDSRKNKAIGLISLFILVIAMFSSMSLTLSQRMTGFDFNILIDYQSTFNLLFWPVYTINIFYVLFYGLRSEKRQIALFLLLIAGLTNGAMLLSPIFSYRSSLYTVYFIIGLTSLLIQELHVKWARLGLTFALLVLIGRESFNYYEKYRFVAEVSQLRKSQIDYYVDHPEIKEAWLVRYPSYTIHSGDIEEWDTYHMDVFRRYFGIQPDVRLVFYNEDWNK